MKNKRAKICQGTGSGTGQIQLNPLKKNINLKNREQLRKRLKGLLEKDKSNVHLLASAKPSIPRTPKVFNDTRKTKTIDKNVSNPIKGLESSKPKVTKSQKQNEKLNAMNGSISTKGKHISVSLKRNSKAKFEPPKKAGKLRKVTGNGKDIPASNSKNRKSVERNGFGRDPTKVKPLNLNKKTANSKQTSNKIENNKSPTVYARKKPNPIAKQKIKQQEHFVKPPKKQKTNVKPYRGPLRPETSESETDDFVPRDLKQKVKPVKEHEVANDEQALTRVGQQSPLDGPYDGDDDNHYYNYNFNKNTSEYDGNTDTETNYSDDFDDYSTESYEFSDWQEDDSFSEDYSYSDSASDETYELPENIAEDVYIANGAAVKHDLSESNEVVFDSNISSAQIIEIPSTKISQSGVRSVKTMPSINSGTVNFNHSDKSYESEDSCPELVPIDRISHTHCDTHSDCCSECMSYSGSDSDAETGSFSEENDYSVQPSQMTPEIFQADKAAKQDPDIDIFHVANSSLHNSSDQSPLDRITYSKTNTTMYKIITTNNKVVNTESKIKLKPDTIRPQHKETLPINTTILEKTEKKSFTEITPILSKGEKIQPEKSIVDKPLPSVTSTDAKAEAKNTFQKKSSFRSLFYNAINSNHVIVLVKDPLYVYGTVKLKLIAGSLEIFGYNPKRNESVEIFSPRGYSSLRIEPSKSSDAKASLNEKEILSLTPYFIQADLDEVITNFDSSEDAIVILERNDRSKKVNMLKKYMVEHLFPNMNSFQSDQPFYTSEFLLRCNITLKTDKALVVDPKWRSIILSDNSRVIAIGGKSVGKTTLVRYLINRNLNKFPKILLIDLDIGQPEMFVPQTVSATTLTCPLLGPGYFLNKEPDKAFLVGQTNVVLLPLRYIESVQALLEYCISNKEYAGIPWVINTMGYNKGFGDELIAVICNLLQPTNIIQLESPKEINNFDVIMTKDNLESIECNIVGDMFTFNAANKLRHNLTLMQSVIPKDKYYQREWDMNPRDMRLAMIISRLSTILTGHAEWLTDIKPFCASTKDLEIVNMGDDEIDTEDLLKALVGNLIYLCRKNGQAIECLGIGIVRGVDYNLKQVFLLPAVPLKVLENVNCLAICGIPLPSSILINQGPKVKGVASYVYNTFDKSSSMYIKQIYNRPQQFLSGKRKSVAE